MKKCILFLHLILLSPILILASTREKRIDSLIELSNSNLGDSIVNKTLIELAYEYEEINADIARQYVNKSIVLSKEANYKNASTVS